MIVSVMLMIVLGTVFITLAFCYKVSIEKKLLFCVLAFSIMMYSGIGIAYEHVADKYILCYYIFLIVLFGAIRIVSSDRISFLPYPYKKNKISLRQQFESDIDKTEMVFCFFSVLFIASLAINIIYPVNRTASLFQITNFTSAGIHARRAERNSTLILKLADTINISTKPFFFVYLYQLIRKNKGVYGFVWIFLWIWLEFGKYNYLSRYEMVIYMAFIIFYGLICRYKTINIDFKTVGICFALAILMIPFLVSYVDIRLGREAVDRSFFDALLELIETECFYPQYYENCIENAGLIRPFDFLLWMLFLPIPSALWKGKPIVQISYAFTALYTDKSIMASNYSNMLPSILGEAFLIFGENYFWVEALVMGLVIGLYFKFFLKSKRLSVLTAYMILMLATIGRGGAQSYLAVLINGSIILIIWMYICSKFLRNRRIKMRCHRY